MKYTFQIIFLFLIFGYSNVTGMPEGTRTDGRIREYITAKRIVWQSDESGVKIKNSKCLLNPGISQAVLSNKDLCELNPGEDTCSFILDFGKEIQGELEIVSGIWEGTDTRKVRIRFGESVSEVMAEINEETNATNEHSIRDEQVLIPWLGKKMISTTGFRFVRIDFAGQGQTLILKEINAISIYRDTPYLGSFECNDTLLNRIWKTGAYTVHLNMQEYLWDGIKRDRLVWIGDMHPEVMTINAVFGYQDVVTKSLDMVRDLTPVSDWMNGISSYSMWWILIHKAWYMNHGDLKYLNEQKIYMGKLLQKFCTMVDDKGHEHLDGNRFLDWPTSTQAETVDAGYHALLKMTLEAGAEMMGILGDKKTAELCKAKTGLMSGVHPSAGNSKQAAALLCLANSIPDEKANEILSEGGAKGFSTFYGFYMLKAMAKAGNFQGALDIIRAYWGGMLKLGATTFWEDFNIDWMKNAGRIDELPQPGKVDVHATYGDFCYKKLRHSLCHGWASGPTSWLSENVLGVHVLEPGCKSVRIDPRLGDLKWVKGTYPTPYGVIKIEHRIDENGNIQSKIDAPDEVKIVK